MMSCVKFRFLVLVLLHILHGFKESNAQFYRRNGSAPLVHFNCPHPTNFPKSINIAKSDYVNWAQDMKIFDLWTAYPTEPEEVVELANWAYENGYKLRANGYMHNWSPLTITEEDNCQQNYLLVDTTNYLTKIKMASDIESGSKSLAAVKVQAGATMENVMTYLEKRNYGLYASPAPGQITVGGVIAIGGHGTGIPLKNEALAPGHTYGSISNLIVSLKAVVWDSRLQKYVLQSFHRSHPDTKAFMVHLGRAFITEVTLRVGPNYNLRCESFIGPLGITGKELYASPKPENPFLFYPETPTRTFANLVEQSGRVETIWFPFTRIPWTKTWTVSPTKALMSRGVSKPYNYAFAEGMSLEMSNFYKQLVLTKEFLTPFYNLLISFSIKLGLYNPFLPTNDLWGPSKNLLLYVDPNTLRVTANGYAIITSRNNIQNVISSSVAYYLELLTEYKNKGQFPINKPIEIRVTGLDQLTDVGIPNAEPAVLSSLRPIESRPDWDVAVWLDVLSYPETKDLTEFMTKYESFIFNTFDGRDAFARPEWSKGWAYTNEGTWVNEAVLKQISRLYGGNGNNTWNWAIATLNSYDPHNIFTNSFLNSFLITQE